MGLFLTKDISSAYIGGASVKEIYLGGTKIWPLGLPSGTTFKFDYTGDVQSVDLPAGSYKLQCWGAQGGSVTGSYATSGSKGGYSEGILNLTEPTTLYIFVGGQGTSYTSSSSQTSTSVVNGGWNGGGAGRRTSRYNSGDTDGRSFPRGGGGATDIALVTSTMSYSSGRTTRDSESLLSRIIVAGGGAGASARVTIETDTYTKEVIDSENSGSLLESVAGNIKGYCYGRCEVYMTAGTTYYVDYDTDAERFNHIAASWWQNGELVGEGVSFTPSSSGTYVANVFFKIAYLGDPYSMWVYHEETDSSTSTSSGKSSAAQQGGGTSGKGRYPGTQASAGSGGAFGLGANQSSTNYRYCGGGGGGGWYGGGAGKSDSYNSYVDYSGGGSGFVNIAANASYRPSGYTGLQLESGTTIAGNTSHPSISGGTEIGHSGNGYAIITVL